MTGRPALPPGPYLVVGLARSGAAAAPERASPTTRKGPGGKAGLGVM